MKTIWGFLCCLLLLCSLCAGVAAAEPIEVANQAGIEAVLDEMNANSQSYEIQLVADINYVGKPMSCSAGTLTIYGNDHTLTFGDSSYMSISGQAVVNLGSEAYEKKLVMRSTNNYESMIRMTGNARLVMYDGVQLNGSTSLASAGGITMRGRSEFLMHGGEISNCNNEISVSGGVFLDDYARFDMYDGVIRECTGVIGGAVGIDGGTFTMHGGLIEDCHDVYYGGGAVHASYLAAEIGPETDTPTVFEMLGGTIRKCSGQYGGGILLMSYDENSYVNIDGGEITECKATDYGGGIMAYIGDLTVSGKAKIYNNQASVVGDDLLNYGTVDGEQFSTMTLVDPPSDLFLKDCKHEIDGWYADGVFPGSDSEQRWSIMDCREEEEYAVRYTPEKKAETRQIALKAAHGKVNAIEQDIAQMLKNLPQTGDHSKLLIWLALLGCATAAALYRRKCM